MNKLRFAFAGDRDIAVWVLDFLIKQEAYPLALLVTEKSRASHADDIVTMCPFLESKDVIQGKDFRNPEGIKFLHELELDYLVCIHFPYIIPMDVLRIPKIGVLNLHPAYLPYNRGWHTPTWAILENTPVGGTLHFMDEGIDTGDIIHQKQLEVLPEDTANTLYSRLKKIEFEVFQEAWPLLVSGSYHRQKQDENNGSTHNRRELHAPHIQKIDLEQNVKAGDLIRRLRALTTNRIDEATYYEVGDEKYRIQVTVHKETSGNP